MKSYSHSLLCFLEKPLQQRRDCFDLHGYLSVPDLLSIGFSLKIAFALRPNPSM